MNKILTIVVPTYNMERYLDKCLTSLILPEEQMPMLEVLVINDGSKDRSSEIAHGYEAKYPQTFRVIDKENGNYGSCINRGLKEATGKYIKILDADDCFDIENFSSFLFSLNNIDSDCILSDMIKVDDSGKGLVKCSLDVPPNRFFSLKEVGDEINNLWMHNVCYKTDILRKIHYHQTEGISYTDQEWVCLPMSACSSLIYFPQVIYKYLVGREGQTIDINIWEKNFWMETKGCKAMMELRKIDFSPICVNRNYIENRIKVRMWAIYKTYMFRFSTFLNEEIVRDIDKCLLQYDYNLYHYFDTIPSTLFLPTRIIKLWRKGYKKMIVITRLYVKMISTLKRLVKKLLRK